MSDPRTALESDRLWQALEEVSEFGATPAGGVHRLAASAEDGQARDWLVARARALGCTVRVDTVGNTFLRRAGSDPSAPAILIGSHLDSQPLAGKYDGTYGVIAGLHVLESLAATNTTTRHPVEVVCWTNEEGARFAPAMMGSAFHAGRFTAEDLLARTDLDGHSLGEALAAIGYAGTDEVGVDHACYLELHIEQGPLLEDAGVPIGVVTGVQGMRWTRVHLTGQAGHAGTYPMERRRDALVAAAELVAGVRRIGLQYPEVGRATVGRLLVVPNSPNVIPGSVELMVEFRHPQGDALDAMESALQQAMAGITDRTGVAAHSVQVLDSPVVRFAPGLVDLVGEAADACGLPSQRMISGAGHDACQLAPLVPTAMVFIPCVQGISHAEDETISPQWAFDGVRVLLEAVLRVDAAPAALA